MRRAAIYCRISQDRAGAGLGVERQREDCEALAATLGWHVATVLTDNDVSAYSGKRRPGYEALLDSLRSGETDAVLVWHTDRLHRSPVELEEYVSICDPRGIVTQTVQAGELDLATPSGRLVARQLGAVARYEVEHKSARTKRAQLQAAQAGKWLGGHPPFGWKVHLDGSVTIVESEAQELRSAASRVLSGVSLASIIRDLNERSITTSTGKNWNYTSLRQVLCRARNAGLTEFRGEILGGSVFPAILDEHVWRELRDLFASPDRRRSYSNRLKWMLSGLALCACGSTVKTGNAGRSSGEKVPVYRCRERGPGHVGRSAVAVDQYVSEVVIHGLSRPDAAEILRTPEDEGDAGIQAEVVSLRNRIGEAGDLWENGTLAAADYAQRVDRLRSRLAELEARQAATHRNDVLRPFMDSDVRSVWERLAVEQRRAVVDTLMTVTLLRVDRKWKRVFHSSTVKIEWKVDRD